MRSNDYMGSQPLNSAHAPIIIPNSKFCNFDLGHSPPLLSTITCSHEHDSREKEFKTADVDHSINPLPKDIYSISV